MTKKEALKNEAVGVLKTWGVNPETVVYAKVTRVSASGMSRRVQLSIIGTGHNGRPEIHDITYWAAHALGWSYKEGYNQGISVGGCGMDMLFHTVDCLSYAMGYGKLKQTDEDKGGLIYKKL